MEKINISRRTNRSLFWRFAFPKKKEYIKWTTMKSSSDVSIYSDQQQFIYYKDGVLCLTPCYKFNLIANFNVGVNIVFAPFNHK